MIETPILVDFVEASLAVEEVPASAKAACARMCFLFHSCTVNYPKPAESSMYDCASGG